jgi:hypothetical protein
MLTVISTRSASSMAKAKKPNPFGGKPAAKPGAKPNPFAKFAKKKAGGKGGAMPPMAPPKKKKKPGK